MDTRTLGESKLKVVIVDDHPVVRDGVLLQIGKGAGALAENGKGSVANTN